MKTNYHFVYFLDLREARNIPNWHCYGIFTDRYMGKVDFDLKSGQYCYLSDSTLLYSAAMLKEISDFVDQLNKQ